MDKIAEIVEVLDEAESVIWQYKSDLLYPPEGDSIGRRLERASEAAYALRRARKHLNGE